MTKRAKILYLQYSPQFTGHLFDIMTNLPAEYEFKIVHTREDFVFNLHEFKPDLVMSEEGIPAVSSAGALRLVQEVSIDIPFIFLAASTEINTALEMLEDGASDYIILERPHRLPFVLKMQLSKVRVIKKMEQALSEKSRLYQQNLAGVFNTNIEGRIRSCNPAFATILGYDSPEELLGRDINAMYLSDKDRQENIYQLLEKGRVRNFESTLLRQDGQKVHLLINSYLLYDPILEEEVCEGVIIDYTDTAQILLDLDQHNAHLTKRNRNLEQFTYVISHNLRAPISNIIGITELLKDADSQQQTEQLINKLHLSISTIDNIIKDLSHTIQVKDHVHSDREEVHFKQIIDEIAASINHLIIEKQVSIHVDFKIPALRTIRGYIYSIFYNITLNSIKYQKEGVPPVITIQSQLENNKLLLTFQDNGKGFDMKKNGKKVFGLYQRFDTSTEGKGMGLFMVKTQIEDLQGSIEIESAEGEGTLISIRLPLS